MVFEFTWSNPEGGIETCRTSCPKMGELIMTSRVDFPARTDVLQAEFNAVYGGERGKFEQFLRQAMAQRDTGELPTGIQGLSVRLRKNGGAALC